MLHNQPRVIGTETEFGISCPGNPAVSPILTSTAAVMSYADALGWVLGGRAGIMSLNRLFVTRAGLIFVGTL